MSPKVFLTGGTGYIGGTILHALATTHPNYTITVLLRNTPPAFPTTYPNIRILIGDYESAPVLTAAAADADIVVHNGNSDHEPSLKAIIAGLLSKETPGYLLHLSGTGIVSDWANLAYLGTLSPKVWSDDSAANLREIRNLPDKALHRNTEKILFDTIDQHSDKINIAIMCPPDIYGPGRGLARTTSVLTSLLLPAAQKAGGSLFYYKDGTNTRSWVHIADLTRLYLRVIEVAASPSMSPVEKSEYFNAGGYHFTATQEHSQHTLASHAAAILHRHGMLASAEPVAVDLETIDTLATHPRFPAMGRYMFASNSRTRAEKGERLWGYKGEEKGLLEGLEEELLSAVRNGQRGR